MSMPLLGLQDPWRQCRGEGQMLHDDGIAFDPGKRKGNVFQRLQVC